VFPRGVGDLIAVEFRETSARVHIMGAVWPAVAATVGLMLEPFSGETWDAEVLFVRDEGLPFALLGYEGFLNRWAVSFNGYDGYFVVESVEGFHERQPPQVMQRLQATWPHLFHHRHSG
jgi:hypothetical protein